MDATSPLEIASNDSERPSRTISSVTLSVSTLLTLTCVRLPFGPHTVPTDDAPPSRGTRLLHQTLAALLPHDVDVKTGADGAVVAAWAIVHGLAVLILDQRVRYDPDVIIPAVLRRAVAMVAAPVEVEADERSERHDH